MQPAGPILLGGARRDAALGKKGRTLYFAVRHAQNERVQQLFRLLDGQWEESKTEKEFVARLAVEAGKILERHRGARVVRVKCGADIVTEADEAAERFLRGEILACYPDHRVVGEEYGSNEAEADWEWMVDPLDGTLNFSRGSTYFAVSIGVAYAGEPQVGAVCRPLTGELFLAERGAGATLNGEPLHVSEIDNVGEGIFVVDWSRQHTRGQTFALAGELFFAAYKVRSFGSASLDICAVAAGQMEGFVHPGLAPWDFAAAQLILEEAGGRVTTVGGERRTIEAGSVLATNGRVHREALALLQRGSTIGLPGQSAGEAPAR